MAKSMVRVEILVRVIADLLILNASLVIAIVPRAIWTHGHLPSMPALILAACLMTTIGPFLFYRMGFYTRGRSYASRYKALVIVQASCLLFLIVALCLYFIRLQPSFSRSILLLDWAVSTTLLLGSRLWVHVWKYVVAEENKVANGSRGVAGRQVLVIGGAGYIGSALLPKLLDRGYRVRLLDCFLYGEEPIKPFMTHPNLEIHRGDFRNIDTVVAAMKDVKSVVHLGAIVGDPACALDEELTIQTNLIATRMIAQVAKGNGISRFVFASSCSVYGASDLILNEKSALNPVSLYARSKVASEQVLLPLRGNGFEPVILRFGTIYGLSGRTRFDLVVNLLTAKALMEGVITVIGKDQWRPFLHVHDAARSVLTCLDARPDSVSPVIFNVGSDEQNMTLGQIGELIRAMVPGARLQCTEGDVDRRNYRVEFRRIREAIGFEPVWRIEAGVQQILDAIKSGKVVDYHDAKYSNVKFLSAPTAREHLPVMEDWVNKVMQYPSEVPAQA